MSKAILTIKNYDAREIEEVIKHFNYDDGQYYGWKIKNFGDETPNLRAYIPEPENSYDWSDPDIGDYFYESEVSYHCRACNSPKVLTGHYYNAPDIIWHCFSVSFDKDSYNNYEERDALGVLDRIVDELKARDYTITLYDSWHKHVYYVESYKEGGRVFCGDVTPEGIAHRKAREEFEYHDGYYNDCFWDILCSIRKGDFESAQRFVKIWDVLDFTKDFYDAYNCCDDNLFIYRKYRH